MQRFAKWRAVVFLSVVLLALSACRDDEKLIGLEVQPEDELVPIETIDTFSIQAFTVAPVGIDLRTDEVTSFIGQTNTSQMGVTRSSVNVSFRLEGEPLAIDGSPFSVDSVVLHLRPAAILGDYPIDLPVNIFQVRQRLFRDSSYYSDSRVAIDPDPVGTGRLALNAESDIGDSILLNTGDTALRQVFTHRIRLNNDLGEQLLFGLNIEYQTSTEFEDYFHGLQIAIDSTALGSEDAGMMILGLVSGESGIRLYLSSDNEQISLFYPIDNNSARFNTFQHNYRGSLVEQAFNTPGVRDNELYIKGMAGCRAEIRIPGLTPFAATVDGAISKATLSFRVSDNQPTSFDPAYQLFLIAIDSVENTETNELEEVENFTFDFLFSTERYGGRYDEASGSYEFDVTRQVQAILENAQLERNVNRGFRLIREIYSITSASNVPSETVLEGADNIELKLHMTKLNP